MQKRILSLLPLLALSGVAHAQVDRSFERIVTGNGHAIVSYDRETARIDTFLEHPFRFLEPREDREDLCFEANESRDLAYDAYFGVRVDGAGTWLGDVPVTSVEHEVGTNIIVAEQRVGDLRITTRLAMPFGIEAPVLLLGAEVENLSADASHDVAIYSLFNFRLGDAAGGREPSADREQVAFDGERNTFYEYSDASQGTIAYMALSPLAHATASTGDAGVFGSLQRGEDLNDNRTTSGETSDVAPGMQSNTETLAPGGMMRFDAAIAWALDEDAGPVVEAVRSQFTENPWPSVRDEWAAWLEGTTPASEMGLEEDLYAQSLVVLRMGQVREAGDGFGQILASLPPGLGFVDAQWNISWVRDMAYAVAGLIRAGKYEEAKAAIEFQLNAPRGRHTLEVGRPYRISITRYFGNGEEESDCNADGPNIEFDGFGLFLWTLGMYLDATNDMALLEAHWPVIRDEIAEVLVSLIDPSGVIAADSSIWEVHWNGKQRRFTYTSLAAVRGLCDAAAMATRLGNDSEATRFSEAATGIGDALMRGHLDARGALGQSAEDIIAGSGYLDAATVEAVNWGVIRPEGNVATRTLQALIENLTVETGFGLMRNDDGGWYDSQEWVFVDYRTLQALPDVHPAHDPLTEWLHDQAEANELQISELLTADQGEYAGSIPMVGFGGGAYIMSTASPMAAACGMYADRDVEGPVPDGGMSDSGVSDGGTSDAGTDSSAGDGGILDDDVAGCSCRTDGARRQAGWFFFTLGLLFLRKKPLRLGGSR